MSHYAPVVSALVSMLLTTIIMLGKFGKHIQDVPNERSLHTTPTPRVGGIGIMAGLLSGWALMLTSLKWWVIVPLLLLFIVSLLDDVHNLPVKKRLGAQLVAALTLVLGSGIVGQQGIAVALVLALTTVWMTNLYNFMDGSDGFAGGMALIGFSIYGIAALDSQHQAFAMLNFTIGAASLGFLYNNFPPAKIFMGDAGSIPLGFLVAAMGLWGWQQGCWPAWFPILVFSPFIVDATVTLTRRSLRKAKVTEAHREHYYQRLVQSGWSHRKLAMVAYVLMLAAGISALSVRETLMPWPLLLVWAAIYTTLMLLIDLRWQRTQRA